MATRKPQRKIRMRSASHQLSADVMPLLMQRFDTVDKDNTEIKLGLNNHIAEDAKVHAVVEQHKTYWGIVIKSFLGLIAGGFAVFLAWFGMR